MLTLIGVVLVVGCGILWLVVSDFLTVTVRVSSGHATEPDDVDLNDLPGKELT